MSLITFTIPGVYFLLSKLLPVDSGQLGIDLSGLPSPLVVTSDTSVHELTAQRYRQIGSEIHLLTYTASPGLWPFSAVAEQKDKEIHLPPVGGPHSGWLRFHGEGLEGGVFRLTIKSLKDPRCRLTVELTYDEDKASEIADASLWFRHGSFDELLDVRVIKRENRYFLKDFAGYHDGRRKTYLLEGIPVDSLESSEVEVRPGYLYTVTARWIDGSYNQWWNKSRHRTSRLQAVWIEPDTSNVAKNKAERLTAVRIPGWFRPSESFNPHFDTLFPEFSPAENKLVMMYRLNQDTSPEAYLKRGVTHLPRWEHDVPPLHQHWTEAPGFFQDRDQHWFGSLSKQQVEEYADRVGNIGAYAYDFEFWNRQYSPAVKQRLLWFSRRLKENNPSMYLFDYWGGSAYMNTTFQNKDGQFSPLSSLRDYRAPRSNHFNFEKNAEGDFFGNYYNVSIVDVYPRPPLPVGSKRYHLNNYLVLSAIHASRINRLFDFQQDNKTIWFAWNRFMPLYRDPPFPWHVATADPAGSLIFNGLETIPASQALSLSLFSLIEGDGFYLWNDSQPWGRGTDNYTIDNNVPYQPPTDWWPADGITPADKFSVKSPMRESPRYWDYASDFFALGNWMAAAAGDIPDGGKRLDLPFLLDGKWHTPETGQAVLAAHYHLPFVTAVQKDSRILVLALDSFQPPGHLRKLTIRLPDNTETEIELFGNWPSLYTGTLHSAGKISLSE